MTAVNELQLIKYNLFKSQDPENGRFDVVFEINEKKLYAHKNVLNLVSDVFDSMLSNRWNSNEKPIKIATYQFEEFCQFLTFLYSGVCELTNENILSMIDISEFYQIKCFKKYCDEFISKTELTEKNIFVFLELADKYSLTDIKNAANLYISNNFMKFVNSADFLKMKKTIFEEIVINGKLKCSPENHFRAVYKWSEKQAIEKRDNSLSNTKLDDLIKAEIADFLPHIKFVEMSLTFLHEYIVPRGFIFSSYTELSKILCNQKVANTVTNSNQSNRPDILVVVFIVLMILLISVGCIGDFKSYEIEALKNQIEGYKNQIESYKNQIEGYKNQIEGHKKMMQEMSSYKRSYCFNQ